MPITTQQKNDTSLLEVQATGKLTHEDYERLTPVLEGMVERHGKIRILFEMADFHGWEPHALWDDIKIAAHHVSSISRIAMVGEKAWQKAMGTLCRPFTKASVRYFDHEEIDAARLWLETPAREGLRRPLTLARPAM